MTTRIGFTGTQQGMTASQRAALRKYLLNHLPFGIPVEFHHGDCIGADAQAAEMALDMGLRVVSHPPIIASKRACVFCHEARPAKPYLDRNHDIVDETDMLLATPKEATESVRSGTWATIRYARKRGKRVVIFLPVGGES